MHLCCKSAETSFYQLEEMKDAWSEENDKIEFKAALPPTIAKAHRLGLLTGLTQPPDRSTILASLPSKNAADKLVLRFFTTYNPAIPARCKFPTLDVT